MVMHEEVAKYQCESPRLSSSRKGEFSAGIMERFRKKGVIPGAYEPLWEEYERRLQRYQERRSRRQGTQLGEMG